MRAHFIATSKVVPGVGVEPTRTDKVRGILSPLCLPIPPSGRGLLFSWQLLRRQGAGVARRGPSRYTARGSAVTGEARQGGTFSYDSALSGSCRTPAPVGAEGRESSSGHVPRPSRTVRQLRRNSRARMPWGASPARYPVRDRPPCRCRGKASAREFVVAQAQSAIVHGRGRPCSGAWPWTSASVRHSPCRGRL